MTDSVADAVNKVAEAISTPPTAVSELGSFASFLYTWQSALLPIAIGLVGILAGFRKVTNERLERQLFIALENAQLQYGILRALRGEVAANLYLLSDLFEESERKQNANLASELNLQTALSTANHARLGYLSARPFAMLEVLYQRLKKQYSNEVSNKGYLHSETFKSIAGNLLATAVFMEKLEGTVPEIARKNCKARIDFDPEGIIKTKLYEIKQSAFEDYISNFETSRQALLREFYSAWLNKARGTP